MQWFVDFDDTLAIGPNYWALNHVLPQMIEEHQLPFNEANYQQAIYRGMQQVNDNASEQAILDELFQSLGWSPDKQQELVERVFSGYQPHLFDDALPFLNAAQVASQPIYIISNNNHSPDLIESLNIRKLIADIFTPKLCGDIPGKPKPDLWDYVQQKYANINVQEALFVGDDPWSDGAFADAIGMPCAIIDRTAQFKPLYQTMTYRWINSLTKLVD